MLLLKFLKVGICRAKWVLKFIFTQAPTLLVPFVLAAVVSCTNMPSDQDGLDSGASGNAPTDDLSSPSSQGSSNSGDGTNSGDAAVSNDSAEKPKDDFFDLTDNPSQTQSSNNSSNNDPNQAPIPGGDNKLDQEMKDTLPADPLNSLDNTTSNNQPNNEPEISTPHPTVEGGFSSGPLVNITGLKYKANDAGGTVIVEADGAFTFTSRSNEQTRQLIIEIPNSRLSKKLKRGLNTKDMVGSIGSVDAYQKDGSNIARVVVQLRKDAPEPTVQQEGNRILVMGNMGVGGGGSGSQSKNSTNGGTEGQDVNGSGGSSISQSGGDGANGSSSDGNQNGNSKQANGDSNLNGDGSSSLSDENGIGTNESEMSHDGSHETSAGMLKSHNLAEFLSTNTKFYGKKVSIELDDVEVRDVLKFIIQESGANMVISEEVKGKVNLKLRQVPWDQALMTVMRVRKLGYTRQGNILRIAPLAELKSEEDDASKAAQEKRKLEPLKVRMFPINYAKATEIQTNLKEFLTEGRGKALADPRTNYLVVSDIEENLDRIAKLITSLDVQPPQVLIEGKIVEAKESFIRSFGVTWSLSGQATTLAKGKNPLSLTPQLAVNPGAAKGGNFDFNLTLGTLDLLGDLAATLDLAEHDETVKVISSPRVVTMSNTSASITQSTQLPYTSFSSQNGQTTQSTQFKALSMSLKVDPQVTSDGSVVMKVNVTREFPGAAQGNGSTDFSVNSRTADTNVLVRNGQTAVIGGIYQSDATETDDGVPYLKDIPGLGALFRSKSWRKEKSELLVFLTPRILGQADSQAITPGSKEAL